MDHGRCTVCLFVCESLIHIHACFSFARFDSRCSGICAGAIITGTLAALTDIAKKESRGREMGFYDFCTLGGYGLGFIFALVLINGNASRAALPFYAGSIIALIGAVVSLILLKDQMVTVRTSFPLRENIKKIIADRKTLASGRHLVCTHDSNRCSADLYARICGGATERAKSP